MKMRFYKDWKDDIYFAVPDYGTNGIFKLNMYKPGDKQWQYLPPHSEEWDSAHQYLFRNNNAIEISPFGGHCNLPELPLVPDPPPEGWKEHFREKAHAKVSEYPLLMSLLSGKTSRRKSIYILLHEDRYETSFGDGKYHYLAGVFGDREAFQEQKSAREAKAGVWDAYHDRYFTLEWDDDFYFSNDFEVKIFEHFTFEEALKSLERGLSEESK
ncbi:MAG: hypothetical protein PVJ78_05200 [Gammaproteobacteria bacterium]|jgi:hypothetical protein